MNLENVCGMIKGIGIDIVEIARFKELLSTGQDRFVNRHFTPDEIAYCSRKVKKHIHFAGRFAAKEALYKALQLKWINGFQWKHISIRNNEQGAPEASLSDTIAEIAKSRTINAIHLSISHSREYAVAFVVLTD